jgi:uncharacterized membrane protein YdjX (TVP38/TMEM64 family)
MVSNGSSSPAGRRSRWIAIAVLVVVAGLLALAVVALAPHLTKSNLERWVRGAGAWGPVVLLSVQIGQILLAPIPGLLVPVLAGLLYGPVVGPLVTAAGTAFGSMLAYWIGRTGGRPVASRLVGQPSLQKAQRTLRGHRWLALVPLFLFPFSPADALCFVAGIIDMDWSRFLLAVAIGRVPKDALIAVAAGLGWSWSR